MHHRSQLQTGRVPRVIVVGAGFAGFAALRILDRRLPPEVELVAVNETDYSLHTSLLPDVAAGLVDPRHVAIPLARQLARTRVVVGAVEHVDVAGRTARVSTKGDGGLDLAWDRLILNPGSITRTFGIPGVREHARSFKTISEAVFLRDHLLSLVERAAVMRSPTLTITVVGGGFAGVEFAGQAHLMLRDAVRAEPSAIAVRTVLVNSGERLVPQFPVGLSRRLQRALELRGVEVRAGTRAVAVTPGGVALSDGASVAGDAVVWAAGVEPNPLVSTLGLPTIAGRLEVDRWLRVPTAPEVFAVGDAAAVPDVVHPGSWMAATGQHARREGATVARNVLASLGHGRSRPYRHRNLGFAVDLGGTGGGANPLGIPMTGLAARTVARAYHLYALPDNRARVLADWMTNGLNGRQVVSLGLLQPASAAPVDSITGAVGGNGRSPG
jgi:NADH dehydrogenase